MSISPFPFPIRTRSWSDLSERERSFFCTDKYLPLPESHALQIALLEVEDAQRITEWLLAPLFSQAVTVHFTHEVIMQLGDKWNSEAGIKLVRQWLHDLHIPYKRQIYLIYDCHRVVQLPWKLVVKYWDALSWSIGVKMLALDSTRQWECCFHHEDVITFSSFDSDPLDRGDCDA